MSKRSAFTLAFLIKRSCYKFARPVVFFLIVSVAKVAYSLDSDLYLKCTNWNAQTPHIMFRIQAEEGRNPVDAQYFSFNRDDPPQINEVRIVDQALVQYFDDFVISIKGKSDGPYRIGWHIVSEGFGWVIDRESGNAIFVSETLFSNRLIHNKIQRLEYFAENVDRIFRCRSESQEFWLRRYEKAREIDRERSRRQEAEDKRRLEEQRKLHERRLEKRLF